MTSTQNKLAIFDIDGTLTDSVAAHQSAFLDALTLMNYTDYSTDWNSYPHHTDLAIYKSIYESQTGKDIQEDDVAAFEQHVADCLLLRCAKSPITPVRDAALFLKRLSPHYDIVFATGSLRKPALLKLQQAGIALDDTLIIACNGLCSREEIVAKAIEAAKAHYDREQYDRILSFGDGIWDFRTAQALGLEFIGIANSELTEHGVSSFFPHYADEDLYALLGLKAPDPDLPDFIVGEAGSASHAFLNNGVYTFQQALRFVHRLPYGRNANKELLVSVFTDGCGTCGTKHALLKQLCDENEFHDVRLMTGVFRMHERNTPAVANTLQRHRLAFIPEVHNYLRYHGRIIDCTFPRGGIPRFEDDLLEETEIQPGQIGAYKVDYHKAFLKEWLRNNPEVNCSTDELWTIREQCIQDLSAQR